MIFYLVALGNGFLNTFNKMVNVKAGECLGVTMGALINYIEATMITLVLIFITGNEGQLRLEYIKEVPIYFYTGSICGLLCMILSIIGTKKMSAMISMILMLVGQLGISFVLDYIFLDLFKPTQIIGIFLILLGILWKEKRKEIALQHCNQETILEVEE